jgi:hypothetical protein
MLPPSSTTNTTTEQNSGEVEGEIKAKECSSTGVPFGLCGPPEEDRFADQYLGARKKSPSDFARAPWGALPYDSKFTEKTTKPRVKMLADPAEVS